MQQNALIVRVWNKKTKVVDAHGEGGASGTGAARKVNRQKPIKKQNGARRGRKVGGRNQCSNKRLYGKNGRFTT